LSRLSPYFSQRSINGTSTLLGRPRTSSLSRTFTTTTSGKDVFPSSIAFLDQDGDSKTIKSEDTSILDPPVTLRRISVKKDPVCSSESPSTAELALGLSNLTMTDELELKRSVIHHNRGSSDSSNGGTTEVMEKTTPPHFANSTTTTTNTTTTTPLVNDNNNKALEFRVVPMLSPDGKLVGYKQNSSMLRRQMQVSMPFSDLDAATPPESPMFITSSTPTANNTNTKNAEDFYLIASQDPYAGFPDAENQLPGYLLGPIVGRGGFSAVHKGLHIATSLPVAVKVIDKTRMKDPKDRDRVDREMRVMRQLGGHIGIAQLLECAETPQFLYIIMEHCAGGSLLDYVRDKRRISENEACLLFQQILAALQHCHSRGIVHRDIKLENILLDASHSGVKLIDFGLCGYYVHDKPLRCHCGSPSYAAPEIVARKDYMAGPVDVWSAGVVLFAMLAGYLPFQAKDKKSLSSKIIKATWTPPATASPAAVDLLEKMLTLDPEARICLSKIWEHPWVVNGPRWEGTGEGPNGLMRNTSIVDVQVAEAWVCLGGPSITMAALLRALRLKECNSVTAGYHLLLFSPFSSPSSDSFTATTMNDGDINESDDNNEFEASSTSSDLDLDLFI
jgi:5'-AMP-activated protein kinase catalytic alpha subunit